MDVKGPTGREIDNMRRRINRAATPGIAAILVLAAMSGVLVSGGQSDETVRVIVTFKGEVDEKLITGKGGPIDHKYKIIPAIATELTEKDIAALEKSDKVESVEKDVKVSISKKPESPPGKGKGKTPPQPEEEIQWGIEYIKADEAWDTSTGSGVKVGVIDTGIDKDHLDLRDNIVDGINYVKKGKGKLKTDNWNDGDGHGTYVAGIIAAVDNDIGVVGVAPEVDLYIVKALDDDGYGYVSDVVAGIDWCVDKGVQVISMSLGGEAGTTAIESACANAYSLGVVLVAAAGNDGPKFDSEYTPGDDSIDFPARYPTVIAVGGMINTPNYPDDRMWRSSVGPSLELMAPASFILSTWNDGGYASKVEGPFGPDWITGTSVACPHVAGTIALVLGTTPTSAWNSKYDTTDNDLWDPEEVRQLLQDTADDLWGVDDPPSPLYGWGLVDAQEAVEG